MSRSYKGAVVQKVVHPKTKREGVIRLDKRTMTFFAREFDAEYTTEPFASTNGTEVERWLMEQLKRTAGDNNLEWIPVIEVETGGASHHYYRDDSKENHKEDIGLRIKRYYIALTRDEREWRVLKWEEVDENSVTCVPDNEKYAASRNYALGPKSPQLTNYTRAFKLPDYADKRDDHMTVKVAYTPELWAGLKQIIATLKMARKQIKELVGTKKGNEAVVLIGEGKTPLLLTSGDK